MPACPSIETLHLQQQSDKSTVGDQLVIEQLRADENSISKSDIVTIPESLLVAVGDTVRVKFPSEQDRIIKFQISNVVDDPDNGILSVYKPLAESVLGLEEGDEFEYLVANRVKKGVVEEIKRSKQHVD